MLNNFGPLFFLVFHFVSIDVIGLAPTMLDSSIQNSLKGITDLTRFVQNRARTGQGSARTGQCSARIGQNQARLIQDSIRLAFPCTRQ